MAHLSLSFLGGFDVILDAVPVTNFGADKARALLAYLAIESARPHRRARLSTMFWPELPENKAAHNLSQTLLRLRQALRESKDSRDSSFLSVTAQDIKFNTNIGCELDLFRFRDLLHACSRHNHADGDDCRECHERLRQAADLYRGELLAGLFVPDSTAFEEWRLMHQEEFHTRAVETLSRLVAYYDRRGEYARVQEYARRLLLLDPWREGTHLQLMRALVQSGQNVAALGQYESYRRLLADELDLAPSAEITLLYERIRSGEPPASSPVNAVDKEAVWLSNQGELRRVTTLACSRGGVTDSEDIQEQMERCGRLCEAVFNRFGGQRASRQGDVCLIFFGYPHAYEDATRRAVHSALTVIAGMEAGEPLRIGVHTGLMMVGERRGPRWQERDLVGTAIEIARGCQRLAAPGEVVVSADALRLVREYFDSEPLDPQNVGTSGPPSQAHRIRGVSGAGSRLEWLAQMQRLTHFVGRREELQRLEACREQLQQGKGQAVVLLGEPGIGKSRLIWELKRRMRPMDDPTDDAAGGHPGILWLSSRCLPHYQDTSLYPIIGLLEQLLGFHASDSQKTRCEKLTGMLAWYSLGQPSALWLLGHLLGLPSDAPESETITAAQREQMRAIFVTLLQKRAVEQTLVIEIEDLQWSDPSTIDWLGDSLAALAAVPCLTILTARPGFSPAWLARPDVRTCTLQLTLGALDADQAELIVMNLAGDHLLGDENCRRIVAQADGVPLFAEELTKMFLERIVAAEPGDAKPAIPLTLLDSLAARLDNLGAAKETAQWAAVLGREFAYSILEACTPYDEQRLQSDLAVLIEAEIIAPLRTMPQAVRHSIAGMAPGRYTFKHALIQEAAYASLLKRTRQVYHRRIAEIMETRFAKFAEARPEILAQHYADGGQLNQAVDLWMTAGEQASVHGATLEALTFFDRALSRIVPEDTERRWRALSGREIARFFRGERPAQHADIVAMLDLADQVNEDTWRAQAHLRRARYASSQADFQGQLGAADAAITAARRSNMPAMEVEALAYRLTALMRLGRRADLPSTVEQILAQAQRIGDDSARAYAMAAVALYFFEAGDLVGAAQMLAQSLDAARRTKSRRLDLESQYHGHLGFVYAQLGLYGKARETLEAGLKLANLMGIGRHQAYQQLNLGFVCWRIGDLETAIQMEEAALKEYSATGEAFGQAACWTYLGYIYERFGNLSAAERCLAEASALYGGLGAVPDKIEAQATQARVWMAQGRREDAQQLIADVWRYLCEQGTEGFSMPSQVYVCMADILGQVEVPGISLPAVLEAGYHELMLRAEKISDPDWRRSFLEHVPENQAISTQWRQLRRSA